VKRELKAKRTTNRSNRCFNNSIFLMLSLKNVMVYLIRFLTKKMLETLQKGRAIELSKTGRNICVPDDFKGSFDGLYERGLIDTQTVMIDGKEILSVFITASGINLLNSSN
jgi:hypothetical protein